MTTQQVLVHNQDGRNFGMPLGKLIVDKGTGLGFQSLKLQIAKVLEPLSDNISVKAQLLGTDTVLDRVQMYKAVFPLENWQAAVRVDGLPWNTDSWSMGSVCYGNGLYVAVARSSAAGAPVIMTSPDGKVWTPRTSPTMTGYRSVCYSEERQLFVAVGGSRITTSPDGINWTDRHSMIDTYVSVCYGNGRFVAVGYGTANLIITSDTGMTWTVQPAPPAPAVPSWSSVCYGNGLFVAVSGYSDDEYSRRIMISTNGINWTALEAPSPLRSLRSVCYGNGLFAVASTTRTLSSPNGTDWIERDVPAGVRANYNTNCYGNGLFLFGADSTYTTRLMSGSDMLHWTPHAVNMSEVMSICYSEKDRRFVAVGSGTDRISYGNVPLPLPNIGQTIVVFEQAGKYTGFMPGGDIRLDVFRSDVPMEQTAGTSLTSMMSQNAITQAINSKTPGHKWSFSPLVAFP